MNTNALKKLEETIEAYEEALKALQNHIRKLKMYAEQERRKVQP